MKKISLFLIITLLSLNSFLFGDSISNKALVLSNGGGFSQSGSMKNYSVIGQSVVCSNIQSGNVSTKLGFIYASSGQNVGIDNENALPDKFQLSQNYPNPFNPSTTIGYNVPSRYNGAVEIAIYNSNGAKVSEVVNSIHSPGHYQKTFNANNISSGIYYYSIKAGSFFEMKKMIFLK